MSKHQTTRTTSRSLSHYKGFRFLFCLLRYTKHYERVRLDQKLKCKSGSPERLFIYYRTLTNFPLQQIQTPFALTLLSRPQIFSSRRAILRVCPAEATEKFCVSIVDVEKQLQACSEIVSIASLVENINER